MLKETGLPGDSLLKLRIYFISTPNMIIRWIVVENSIQIVAGSEREFDIYWLVESHKKTISHKVISSTPRFLSGVHVTRSLVLYVCFVDRCLSFVLFLLTIVLSVLLRYTDSDCPFGIFKFFLITLTTFMVIGTDWTDKFKSNYHANAMMVMVQRAQPRVLADTHPRGQHVKCSLDVGGVRSVIKQNAWLDHCLCPSLKLNFICCLFCFCLCFLFVFFIIVYLWYTNI